MPRTLFPKAYSDFVQRLRVPSGFLLAAGFIVLSRPAPAWLLGSLPLCLAGLGLRTWAAGHLRKNQKLTTSGPYAWLRNPLYLGTLLAALGAALAAGGGLLLALVTAIFFLIYQPVMELEEQHLAKLFGAEFESYAERVPQLIPRPPSDASNGEFTWMVWQANKEWKGLAGFALVYLFLTAKSILSVH